jgi:geranylgeranyl reductase
MNSGKAYDAVVVGGGPAGSIAAADLAHRGRSVLLLDRGGRIKPCGGAIPTQLIREFSIPDELLAAKISGARMVSPSGREVDMAIGNGFVGMVDRERFDEWLRVRAAAAGAVRETGKYESIERDASGTSVRFSVRDGAGATVMRSVRTRVVIGADGANSEIAAREISGGKRNRCVFAYHEIVRSPAVADGRFDAKRCDVVYRGALSPDFYGWVFPHGETTSVGVGSAQRGFSLRRAVDELRRTSGLDGAATVRREGAPIPMRPLKRWDNGRDVLLAGDAAGVVAPASGEGIYYAMCSGRLAADAVDAFLASGDRRCLSLARRKFMRAHGRVFLILGIMQHFWYSSDARRERFVSICRDTDVQKLTWEAYLNKRLVKAQPLAHLRIFFKDLAHLLGLVRA